MDSQQLALNHCFFLQFKSGLDIVKGWVNQSSSFMGVDIAVQHCIWHPLFIITDILFFLRLLGELELLRTFFELLIYLCHVDDFFWFTEIDIYIISVCCIFQRNFMINFLKSMHFIFVFSDHIVLFEDSSGIFEVIKLYIQVIFLGIVNGSLLE